MSFTTLGPPVTATGLNRVAFGTTVHTDSTGKGSLGEESPGEEMRQSRRTGATWKRVLSGQRETDLGQGRKRRPAAGNEKQPGKTAEERAAVIRTTQNISIGKNAWHSAQPNGLQNNWGCTLIPKDSRIPGPGLDAPRSKHW